MEQVLVEEALDIQHEYYLSITIDRSAKMPVILFSEEGGVEIETLAKERPEALRRAFIDLPRSLSGRLSTLSIMFTVKQMQSLLRSIRL